MRSFPKTGKRFVAFFDLMGFKDLVYRNTHSKVSKMMDSLCNFIFSIKSEEKKYLARNQRQIRHQFERGVILPVVFSDSIIFISRSNAISDARKMMYLASYFLHASFDACAPVKGAIAYGTFTADFKISNFFGKPLVDAYLLANEVHFYGAIYHHSFEKYLDDHNQVLPVQIVKRRPVPMKSGEITHCYADWTFHMRPTKNVIDLVERYYKHTSGNTRKYIDNSKLVYCKPIDKQGQ